MDLIPEVSLEVVIPGRSGEAHFDGTAEDCEL